MAGRPRINPEVQAPDQEAKDTVPKIVKTPHQLFWEESAKKGYPTLGYVGAASEDMENPDQNYITLGFTDANGLKIPQITLPKEQWIARAKVIIAKYDKQE